MGKVEGLLIVGAIIMLLFGAKKLPELARSVGESVNELKKGFDPNALASTSKTVEPAKTRETADGTRVDG
jgi:sec-independent protein translocase protein TatA